MNANSYLFLVPLTGLEPVRILLRGILSFSPLFLYFIILNLDLLFYPYFAKKKGH